MTEVRGRDRRVRDAGRPGRAVPGMGRLPRLRELALVPALVVLLVIGAIVNDSFLTTGNLIGILGASAALALVVLGESLVLISGKFDLSLESTVGIAPAIGALLVIPSGFGTGGPPRPGSPRSWWSARWSARSTASSS